MHAEAVRSKIGFWVVIVLTMAVSGCSRSTAIPATATHEPTATPLAQTTSTKLPAPSAPAITLEPHCIPIEDNVPSDLGLSGVWIRNSVIPYIENVDGTGDRQIPFQGGGLFSARAGDAAVSPDGKHVAYIDQYYDPIQKYRPEKRILRVVASSGHSLQMDYWKEDWQWIVGWSDDRTLALYTASDGIVTLNPFSGEWHRFQQPVWITVLKAKETVPGYGDYPFGGFLYSPRLDMVLTNQNDNDVELRDVRTGSVLLHNVDSQAAWSADGSILAVTTGYTLNILRGEQVIDQLDVRAIEPDMEFLGDISLSPNGQRLAIASLDSRTHGWQLQVLDTVLSRALNLCADQYRFDTRNPVSWSADSRFLVGQVYDAQYTDFDVLVDTETMRAFRLVSGEAQHRVIWLAKP